jgi:hypothetical protein
VKRPKFSEKEQNLMDACDEMSDDLSDEPVVNKSCPILI